MVLKDTTAQDVTAESILERLSDLKNHPEETIVSYEEFEAGDAVYYFTPGSFLYRNVLGHFAFDVLSLFGASCQGMAAPGTEPRHIFLALKKHHPSGRIAPYRLGQFAHKMLELWEVPRRLAELRAILIQVVEGGDEVGARTEAATRFALSEGFLVPLRG